LGSGSLASSISFVIRTRTVHAANRNEKTLRSDLDLLIEQAQAGNCSLSATGPLRGERIDLVSDHTTADVPTLTGLLG
jgi:predicted nucleotidyltransferase